MSLEVKVYDDSIPSWRNVHDVYTPQLSRFGPTTPFEYDYIEHIDVVTTWKGLSTSQRTEEVFFWEKAFRDALNSVVEEWLQARMKKKKINLELDEG